MTCLALLSGLDETLRLWIASLGWPAEGVVRLLLAVLAGGLIGFERESRNRGAGFRTMILVCLGSALVMIISTRFAFYDWPAQTAGDNRLTIDPGRIAYGIMTGVGFLGAGTIIERRGRARGLTTAAAIWCVAAIGMAMGFGQYMLGVTTTLLVLVALWLLDYAEEWIPTKRTRTVTVRVPYEPLVLQTVVEKFTTRGINVERADLRRLDHDDAHADITLTLLYRRRRDYLAHEARLAAESGLDLRESAER